MVMKLFVISNLKFVFTLKLLVYVIMQSRRLCMNHRRTGQLRREQPCLLLWQPTRVVGHPPSIVISREQQDVHPVGDQESDRRGIEIFFRSSNDPQLKK